MKPGFNTVNQKAAEEHAKEESVTCYKEIQYCRQVDVDHLMGFSGAYS
jgi:hypothetical protein